MAHPPGSGRRQKLLLTRRNTLSKTTCRAVLFELAFEEVLAVEQDLQDLQEPRLATSAPPRGAASRAAEPQRHDAGAPRLGKRCRHTTGVPGPPSSVAGTRRCARPGSR